MANRTVVVTGDVVVDHHIYEGERKAASSTQRGVRVVREHGGACGTLALIKKVEETGWDVVFGLQDLPNTDTIPCAQHALAAWAPYPEDPRDPKNPTMVWRAGRLMGYAADAASGDTGCAQQRPSPVSGLDPAILVLDDAGAAFRHQAFEPCWLLPREGSPAAPEWVLLKMSGPLCQGDLWHRLQEKRFSDRLICIVSAGELRRECVSLSKGLSWEGSVDDLRIALQSNPVLNRLATRPRHLIVTFHGDGALWLNNSDTAPRATLIYDASSAEGECADAYRGKGEAFGYLSCLVAAVASELMCKPEGPRLARAIAGGLRTMRDLRRLGHGRVGGVAPEGFPVARLATEICKESDGSFAEARVPWTKEECGLQLPDAEGPPWSLVESSQSVFPQRGKTPLLGLARDIVVHGASAIRWLPHARFGRLLTVDRAEIQTLRSLRQLMRSYADEKAEKPLSIGVFGPPGAGKSFGVREIANEVFTKEAWLEFNLAQFDGPPDLIGAFHLVRDKVLSGITPVVFWDEFDSRALYWLQYLLAPMQDGRFQDGQLNHSIGKCVFIFAGATRYSFAEFAPHPGDMDASDQFRLCKGPDFQSRLAAYYDVLGPNQRTTPPESRSDERQPDPRDVSVPLRRALLIRSLLRVPDEARLDFDPELLDALLGVFRYRHGARSLESVVVALRPGDGPDQPIRRSALPPAARLAMHVEDDPSGENPGFAELLNGNASFRMAPEIEDLAKAIHDRYRPRGAGNPLDIDWKELSPAMKEDNCAAARRMPQVLAVGDLTLVRSDQAGPVDDSDDEAIRRHIEHQLERMAEAEHEGWMDHRLRNGWTYGKPRSDESKIHPLLRRYSDLPEEEKEKDRGAVRDYVDHAKRAGYRIVFRRRPKRSGGGSNGSEQ